MRAIVRKREEKLLQLEYTCINYKLYDYTNLSVINACSKPNAKDKRSFADCFIMADTETSKKKKGEENHVVAFTVSIGVMEKNIVTLWGHKPSELIECFKLIMQNIKADKEIIYFHNMPYDFVFIRKFLFKDFGTPENQLNVKSHYPINIEFENGLILRDSLILAQRSLEKWGKDLNIEHQKAVGKWNYNKYRNQHEEFSSDEIEYIEHDTLAGIECLRALAKTLNKRSYQLPFTATGIPREEVRRIGKKNQAHKKYLKQVLNFEQFLKMESAYHGGFCHANRDLVNFTLTSDLMGSNIEGYDFTSSYPFVLLSEKYPSENFHSIECDVDFIVRNMEQYAFMFRIDIDTPVVKDMNISMPCLQFSKMETLDAICDNGRILIAKRCSGYITEQDLIVILSQYRYKSITISECEVAEKDYLPRWFTDYVYQLYKYKCELKYSDDKVAYALAKARLNSLYGLCVQKPVKETIEENYQTGEYSIMEGQDLEQLYNDTIKKVNQMLPYQWGVWCTAYAFKNLFTLGACAGTWIYSDTDSCYGVNWNKELVNQYNENCKQKLLKNNYGAVIYEGKEFWLGLATLDSESVYTEFRVMGAKRYCGRCEEDNELHITVAGVPKKTGAQCLNDDINNFQKGFVFSGAKTGKLTHTYIYVEDIYTDEDGNETGDSINLTECDYLLDSIYQYTFEDVQRKEEEYIEYYE